MTPIEKEMFFVRNAIIYGFFIFSAFFHRFIDIVIAGRLCLFQLLSANSANSSF